jgi:hypothetical protein
VGLASWAPRQRLDYQITHTIDGSTQASDLILHDSRRRPGSGRLMTPGSDPTVAAMLVSHVYRLTLLLPKREDWAQRTWYRHYREMFGAS